MRRSLRRSRRAIRYDQVAGKAPAFAEFIISWRARIGHECALSNLLPLPMSRRDVADYLGLTIETVSRVLAKLEREHVVHVVPNALQLMGSAERPLLFERSHKAA